MRVESIDIPTNDLRSISCNFIYANFVENLLMSQRNFVRDILECIYAELNLSEADDNIMYTQYPQNIKYSWLQMSKDSICYMSWEKFIYKKKKKKTTLYCGKLMFSSLILLYIGNVMMNLCLLIITLKFLSYLIYSLQLYSIHAVLGFLSCIS